MPAKKSANKKTLRSQYTEILSERGIDFNKQVKILGYKFDEARDCRAFHFDCMEEKVPYVLFDGVNGNIKVLVLKDNIDCQEKIAKIAEKNNGKEYKPVID